MFAHLTVLLSHLYDGNQRYGMEAMVAVTEGTKYWETKGWICLIEAGVSKEKKKKKVPEVGEKVQWKDRKDTRGKVDIVERSNGWVWDNGNWIGNRSVALLIVEHVLCPSLTFKRTTSTMSIYHVPMGTVGI